MCQHLLARTLMRLSIWGLLLPLTWQQILSVSEGIASMLFGHANWATCIPLPIYPRVPLVGGCRPCTIQTSQLSWIQCSMSRHTVAHPKLRRDPWNGWKSRATVMQTIGRDRVQHCPWCCPMMQRALLYCFTRLSGLLSIWARRLRYGLPQAPPLYLAGPGSVQFCRAVVMTMFGTARGGVAAIAFDPLSRAGHCSLAQGHPKPLLASLQMIMAILSGPLLLTAGISSSSALGAALTLRGELHTLLSHVVHPVPSHHASSVRSASAFIQPSLAVVLGSHGGYMLSTVPQAAPLQATVGCSLRRLPGSSRGSSLLVLQRSLVAEA